MGDPVCKGRRSVGGVGFAGMAVPAMQLRFLFRDILRRVDLHNNLGIKGVFGHGAEFESAGGMVVVAACSGLAQSFEDIENMFPSAVKLEAAL
jgi:hypothetical protein